MRSGKTIQDLEETKSLPRSIKGQFSFFLITVLCIGVAVQMLGVPLSLWELDGSSDIAGSSILEGFAVISNEPVLFPSSQSQFAFSRIDHHYIHLGQHLFFHPPLPL